MRNRLLLAGLLLSLGLTTPVWSQTSVFSGSYSPQRIVNKPIDISHPVAPAPAARPSSFRLLDIFPKFRSFDFNHTHTTSPLPPPSSFPSTKYKNSFQPLPPVVPQ